MKFLSKDHIKGHWLETGQDSPVSNQFNWSIISRIVLFLVFLDRYITMIAENSADTGRKQQQLELEFRWKEATRYQ